MAPGHAFRFYKPPHHKENVPESSQPAQSAPSSTRVRAFRNTTPAELALKFKQPAEIPLPPRPLPVREIPSTCPQPFKFQPISTPSANPVKLGDCSNASLPQLDSSAGSTLANITSSNAIQSLEIPPAKKAVFRHDKVKMVWASMDEAKTWMEIEEQDKGFKFASKGPIPTHGAAVEWTMKFRYVCSRGASGGKKVYEKKTDRTAKKITSQRDTGCKCALRLTLYPDRVEGSYVAVHNHP
ncbi:hypothetical protein FA13DRAFT_1730188 [Coprinellus micaceus]|uniref:FAR1 domain-containing protein n=1 Tax=Coprinellus micaceus TaxID=71717 RepID=A0A4Y7TIA1_COPMI|nr:hypothetical protein FA13DRAFT_1730188 [Coprinellus micaceus]